MALVDVLCTCWCTGSSHWCLIWSSRMSNRTPCHLWGRLYLLIFLFKEGLLTLMHMDPWPLKGGSSYIIEKWGHESFQQTPEVKEAKLAPGPNYAVVPRHPPYLEYIGMPQMQTTSQEEPLTGIYRVLKSSHVPSPYISRVEHEVMKQLKGDNSRLLLTAVKGGPW